MGSLMVIVTFWPMVCPDVGRSRITGWSRNKGSWP